MISAEQDDIEILHNEMLIRMGNLDESDFTENDIDEFFKEIALIQTKINMLSNLNTSEKVSNKFTNKNTLLMYYNNVRSIDNKENVLTKIELSKYKILVFTEPWLSGLPSSRYFPKMFHVYRWDRTIDNVNFTRRSGGVALLVHSKFQSRQINLNDDSCEYLAIEIKINPPLIIYAAYMRVFDPVVAMQHVKLINELILKFPNHRIIVVGDFNLSGVIWNPSDTETFFIPSNIPTNATEFIAKMQDLALFQLSNIVNVANNVLDLLFSNEPSCISICEDQSGIIDARQQDASHKPYEISIEYCSRNSIATVESEIHCFKRGNYERMSEQIEAINFQHELNMRSPDDAYAFFIAKLNELVLNNVPKIIVERRVNRPEWWSNELQHLKNRRDKAFKRKPKGAMSDEYEKACNEFNKMNDRLENEHINRIQNSIKSDPASFWKFAKIGKS